VTTLADFLAARLDEKESAADDFHDALRCASLDRDGGFELRRCDCGHPARELREVEAGRKILGRYCEDPPRNLGEHLQWSQERSGLHVALLALAAVWNDHPDYDYGAAVSGEVN